MPLDITLACGDYEHTRALRDGSVTAEGVRLTYLHLPPEELFLRQVKDREFPVSEMSLGNHIILTSRPGGSPFVAIPAFTSRVFRSGSIFVNAAAGIERPADLRGKRVGIPEYHLSAALYMRGLLKDEFGVYPEDVEWLEGGLNTPVRKVRLEVQLPPTVRMRSIPDDRCLNDMLVDGEIDALMAAYDPRCIVEGHPNVRRLFADFAAWDRDYYRRTGIYPIMHCIALRRDVHERHPWLAERLYTAFLTAKDAYLTQLGQTPGLGAHRVPLPWLTADVVAAQQIIGRDFWPYGIAANKHTLETALRFAYEQGLTDRLLRVDELFAEGTLST